MQSSKRHTLPQDGQRDELLRYLCGHDPTPADEPLAGALDRVLQAGPTERGRPSAIDVAGILRELGVDRDTLLAALLSDPRLRDELDQEAIQAEHGAQVTRLVRNVHWLNTFKECSEPVEQPPEQAERLRRMLLAMVEDVRAVLIKLAYRVQRLRLLPQQSYEVRRCIARETLDVFAPLANRLGVGQLKWELEDLAFRYLDPQAYRDLAARLEETRSGREGYIEAFKEALQGALQGEGIEAQVMGRPKHLYSIWRKMQRKELDLDQLYDLRAVRVLVDRPATCYQVLGIVHSLWQHIPREFDDYIANPKGNGYQSLHTAVIGPEGRVVEVQIRTREMHEFAEYGIAAHWRYKEGGRYDAALQRTISSLRRLLEGSDGDGELLESLRTEFFSDRVFVFTPRGEVIDLPRGATPLDFAYAIHTEVGHRCRGAKVNGRIVPLTYELASGQRVEVLTARDGEPSRDWLSPHAGYLKTSRARAKVRHWFNQQDHAKNAAAGQAALERELHRLGLKEAPMQDLLRRFRMARPEDLYAAIGRGGITMSQIAGALQIPEFREPESLPTRARSGKPSGGPSDVHIHGVGNLLTEFAQCCKPVPGDEIVGYITRGRGVSVHRRDCPNMLSLPPEKQSRLIEVGWGDRPRTHAVDVHVEAFDRPGLLRDVTAVLANQKVNVMGANSHTEPRDQGVTMELTLEVTDIEQLSDLLDRIAQLPNVTEVHRKA